MLTLERQEDTAVATREVSRQRAKEERLQAHVIVPDDVYEVFNVSKGTSYIVRKIAGFWVCECPWFRRRSTVSSDPCKHVVRVMDKTAKCTTDGCTDNVDVRPGRTGEYLCKRCRYVDRFVS